MGQWTEEPYKSQLDVWSPWTKPKWALPGRYRHAGNNYEASRGWVQPLRDSNSSRFSNETLATLHWERPAGMALTAKTFGRCKIAINSWSDRYGAYEPSPSCASSRADVALGRGALGFGRSHFSPSTTNLCRAVRIPARTSLKPACLSSCLPTHAAMRVIGNRLRGHHGDTHRRDRVTARRHREGSLLDSVSAGTSAASGDERAATRPGSSDTGRDQ